MKTKLTSLITAAACLALLCIMPISLRAAALVVTNIADSGPGSLREALAGAASGDTIDATGVTGTITLTNGQLTVSKAVTLLGPGAGTLTVSGNHASRVFNLTGTNVTIRALTIANGQGYDNGTGINAGGSAGSVVTIRDCVIANNSSYFDGGGICNNPGVTMTISNCTLSGNSAGGSGGGILNERGTLMVVNSTLSGNSAGSSYGRGGGICNDGSYGSATLTINACTLNNNTCPHGGGGICNDGTSGSATLTVNASTLYNNSAPSSFGGGIFNDAYSSGSASVTVNACTLSGNWASGGGGIENGFMGPAALKVNACTFSGNSANVGSAIANYNSSGKVVTLEIGDTILNQPGTTGQCINNTLGTVTSRGYNLASDDGGLVLTASTDRDYTDPKLGPLQNNGGPTFTHALLSGSPAIDKGKANAVPGLASSTDQRGLARPVDFASVGNATGGDGSDIGAFEVQPATIPVTSTADGGPGTLRAALASAASGDTIDATGVSGTITLLSGQLTVSNSVTILGPGAGTLAVSGNNASRVFNVTANNVIIRGLTIASGQSALSGAGINAGGSAGSVITVSDCVVTDNTTTLDGGGICNSPGVTLTVSNCVVRDNYAGGWGGGIFNSNATVTVIASTVRGNAAWHGGGGIMNRSRPASATLTVIASTLHNNSAGYGGAIYNGGSYGSATATINGCTISDNSAINSGSIDNDGAWGGSSATLTIHASTLSSNTGGIYNDGRFAGHGTLVIGDTILNAGASGANLYNAEGTITSTGYNLSSDDAAGFFIATGDQINTNPKLGPLQNNGGPTPTHALLADSPAADKGKRDALPALARNTDQRGLARPVDFATLPNATGGDGSDIGAFESQDGLDTDADGLPDAWELGCFGGLSTRGTDDTDGDGQNNLFEHVAGLDPTDPASVFVLRIENVAGQTHQKNLIFKPWASGRTYTPQFTTNLAGIAFAPLTGGGGPTTNGTEVIVTDLNATEPQVFYRIQISLP